jgi:hypothetical protein
MSAFRLKLSEYTLGGTRHNAIELLQSSRRRKRPTPILLGNYLMLLNGALRRRLPVCD